MFYANFFGKSLEFRKKVVPLHPLSLKTLGAGKTEASSLKRLHKTEEVVVQEAELRCLC